MLIGTDFRHTFGAQAAPDPGLPRRRRRRLRSCERGDGTTRRGAEAPLLVRQNQSCGGLVAPAGGLAAPAGGFVAGVVPGEAAVAGAGAAGVVEGAALLVPAGAAASKRLMTS